MPKIQKSKLDQIFNEYQEVFKLLKKCPENTVTFYGGARVLESSADYKAVFELSKQFAKLSYGIVSGGGTGIMTASLEGAKEAKGTGIGFRMSLIEETPQIFGQIDILLTEFAPRKMALRESDVLIYAPGGFGTLDELMENLTLLKTGKMLSKPMFLYNQKFWEGCLKWLCKEVLEQQLIDFDFWKSFVITSDIQKILELSQNPDLYAKETSQNNCLF